MTAFFRPGQEALRGDLDIFLVDVNSIPVNAYEISYALYYVNTSGPSETEVGLGSLTRTPANPSMGEYFAALRIPPDAITGTYRIKWTFKQYANSPTQMVAQEFTVNADEEARVVSYTGNMWALMSDLRMRLRDHNPDKFYHFRPPEHEGRIGSYNRIFGQIWEDQELRLYLDLALSDWNEKPPLTSINSVELIQTQYKQWKSPIFWAAIVHALHALSINWVADEFDYSIGGVSLSIDKASKYQSLMNDAAGQFDKSVEAKVDTVKIIRGLQQPRFGVGVRSSFGPTLGRGTLSPRSYVP